jgi:hypothetical protein
VNDEGKDVISNMQIPYSPSLGHTELYNFRLYPTSFESYSWIDKTVRFYPDKLSIKDTFNQINKYISEEAQKLLIDRLIKLTTE